MSASKTTAWNSTSIARIQRRTVGTLASSQALGGFGLTIGIAVATLLGKEVTGSDFLAGLMGTPQAIGAGLGAYLIAELMSRRGRRIGLMTGYAMGASGAAVIVLGGVAHSYPLLLLGAFLFGATSSSNLQSRYAATDLAEPRHRARALSIVLWATAIGAVAGPNLSGPAGGLAVDLGLPKLTGPFVLSLLAIFAAIVVVSTLLRPDPLLLAREIAHAEGPVTHRRMDFPAVLRTLRKHPGVLAGVLALASAHPVMVAVMSMTPVHLGNSNVSITVIGFVISVHVLGMFFFSPLFGAAADRFGRVTVLGAGAGTLWLALLLAGTAPEGESVQIFAGLFLLGLGWSMCTVSGSALVTEFAPIDVRPSVQGFADLTMNLTAAAASASGGFVVQYLGYASLNLFAAIFTGGVLLSVFFALRARVVVPLTEV